ncbi:6516_t:CDS:2, partial [Diversispora eburnea]
EDNGGYSPFITNMLDTIVALTYQIADRAYRLQYGQPINSKLTYNRLIRVIAGEIYRAILFMNYLVVATVIYIVPIFGPLISFMYFCWIYAYYRWTLEQRIEYFEERWSYFAGFGFTFTAITFFVDQFLSAGVFALLFPLYIIMANNALPMPRQNESARFSTFMPYKLRIFWVAKKLNDGIINSFKKRANSGNKSTTTTRTRIKNDVTSN